METDAGDGGKGDLMCVRDLDSYGVEIGRGCKYDGMIATIVIATPNVQTTNLGGGSSNLFGRAKLPPFRIKPRTQLLCGPEILQQ